MSDGERARGGGDVERHVERRAFLLLAHDAEPLPLGGAEIEAVRLPLPRHRPGDRAVAGRRSRHRREHRQLGRLRRLERAGDFVAQPARDRAGVAAVLGERQGDELLDERPASSRASSVVTIAARATIASAP